MNQHSPYRQWMRRAMQKANAHTGAQPLLTLPEAKTILALAEKPTTPAVGSQLHANADGRTVSNRAGDRKLGVREHDGTSWRYTSAQCVTCGCALIRASEGPECTRCQKGAS